jgi:hypothetical protein
LARLASRPLRQPVLDDLELQPRTRLHLSNPLANGECGQIDNLAFGSTQLTNQIDPGLLSGWGVRPVGLVVSGVDSAAAVPTGVGGGRLLPPFVHAVLDQRHRHRQPVGVTERRRSRSI